MKKFLPLLALCMSTSAFSQWTWLQVVSPEILQIKMAFSSASTGFMVGTNAFPNGNAVIAKTTNGGTSWTTVYSLPPVTTPTTLTMNDIQKVDQNVLYACGGYIDPYPGIIVKSTNGGTTWDTLHHDMQTSKFLALHFFDANNGLVASNGLWRTSNGGADWTEITLPSGVNDLIDLHFTSSSIGFGVANTTSDLIRTTNGGDTWSPVTIPTTEVTNAIDFFDADHGLIACDNGTILYTTNGGLTWAAGTNPDPDLRHVLCVEMTSATTGYAGTVGGMILHTTNGGQTWTVGVDVEDLNAVLQIASIYDLDFPTSQTGYGCGSMLGTMVKTTNGGGIVGIDELRKEELRMAPNPAITHISYDAQDVRTVQLLSSEGKLIGEYAGAQLNGMLYVGDLSPGAYILKTISPSTLQQGLFIKE